MPLAQFDERSPVNIAIKIDSGAGTGATLIYAPSISTTRLDHFFVTNSDTIDHVADLYLVVSGTTSLWGSFNIPHFALSVASVPLDILEAVGLAAGEGIVLGPATGLQINLAVAISSGFLQFVMLGGTV